MIATKNRFTAFLAALALLPWNVAFGAAVGNFTWTFPESNNQVVVEFSEQGPAAVKLKRPDGTEETVHRADIRALPLNPGNLEQNRLIKALAPGRSLRPVGFSDGAREIVIVTADEILRIDQSLRLTRIRGDFQNYRDYWSTEVTDESGAKYTVFGVITGAGAAATPAASTTTPTLATPAAPAPAAPVAPESSTGASRAFTPTSALEVLGGIGNAISEYARESAQKYGGSTVAPQPSAPAAAPVAAPAAAPTAPSAAFVDSRPAGGNAKAPQSAVGQLFIWRQSDGVVVTISGMKTPTMNTVSPVNVQDGILTVSGVSRQIDFRAFDLETAFVAKPFVMIKDPHNEDAKELISPAKHIESTFMPYTPAPLTRSTELQPEERTIVTSLLNAMAERLSDRSVLLQNGSMDTRAAMVYQITKRLPRTWKIFSTDGNSLSTGGDLVGVISTRVKNMIAASREVPVVYVVSPVASLSGLGVHGGQSQDMIPEFTKAMKDGDLLIIGSDGERFNTAFASNPEFTARFNIRQVPNVTDKKAIYARYVSYARANNRPVMSYDVFFRAQHLLSVIDPVTPEPDRFIAFSEDVVSLMALNGRKGLSPQHEDVNYALQHARNTDPALLDAQIMASRLEDLRQRFPKLLIGQRIARDMILPALMNAFTGVNNPEKPRMAALMSGPAGLGKTELAKVVAKILSIPMLQVDMSRYSSLSDGPKLMKFIGDFLRKNPFGIVFLDELEKAPHEVQNALLVMLNEGIFMVEENADSGGKDKVSSPVSARNALVLAATNAGARFIEEMSGPEEYDEEGLEEALQQPDRSRGSYGISPPLLSRFMAQDGILPFFYASKDEFGQIIDLFLPRSMQNPTMQWGHMSAKFSYADMERLRNALVESWLPKMNNRKILGLVTRKVNTALSSVISSKEFGEGADVRVEWVEGEGTKTVVRARNCAGQLTPSEEAVKPAEAPAAEGAATPPAPATDGGGTPPTT